MPVRISAPRRKTSAVMVVHEFNHAASYVLNQGSHLGDGFSNPAKGWMRVGHNIKVC